MSVALLPCCDVLGLASASLDTLETSHPLVHACIHEPTSMTMFLSLAFWGY